MAAIQTTVRNTKLAIIRQESHGAASQINPRCSKGVPALSGELYR